MIAGIIWLIGQHSALASDLSPTWVSLRFGYSYGELPGYLEEYASYIDWPPERVASGAFKSDVTFRKMGSLWLRLEAEAASDTAYGDPIFREGNSSYNPTSSQAWLNSRAGLEAYWEPPRLGSFIARVGSRTEIGSSGVAEEAERAGIVVDHDRYVQSGIGGEIGVPLKFGGVEISPTAAVAALIPLHARGPGFEQWEPVDFVRPAREVSGRVDISRNRLSLRVSVDARTAGVSNFGKQYGSDPIPPSFSATVLAGLHFPPQRATAETSSVESTGTAQPEPDLAIVDTGIPSIDDLFRPARKMLDTLTDARNALEAFNRKVTQAAGLSGTSSFRDAIAILSAESGRNITVSVDGLRPVINVNSQADGKIHDIAGVINAEVPRLVASVEAMSAIPSQVDKILTAAQALPSTLPADAKAAGVTPVQISALLKKVKTNTQAVAAIPETARTTLREVTETLTIISSLAG